MLRILVALDGSNHSERAVRHMVKLKDELRERLEVLLLNVQLPVPMRELLFDGRPSELHRLEEPLKEHGKRLLEPARAALEAAAIECRTCVEIGAPAEVIARFAASYHCEMIVMGTRGQGAVAALCLGSVPAKVVHLAAVPVLLVP
ncbi:MAG: universal stress protein [Burkholderiales bacterium]